MVYTVTMNPSLDYIVSVENFEPGRTNRTRGELLLPGGKGINVSLVLKNLGIESTALGFLAGFTGEEILRRLDSLGVKSCFIPLEAGFSRINVKLRDIEGTEINGQGPAVSGEKLALLLGQLKKLGRGDVLILSGSIPASVPEDIYQTILRELDGKGVLTAVDTAGEALLKALPFHPFLVKPNHHELGELFGVEPETREQAVPYGRKLQKKGARNVLVSLAGEGAVLLAADGQVFEAPAPGGRLVNGVGAGDSMTAGFLAGWLEREDYGHAFRLGLAAGSASAFSENLATGEEIMALYREIDGEFKGKPETGASEYGAEKEAHGNQESKGESGK